MINFFILMILMNNLAVLLEGEVRWNQLLRFYGFNLNP